MARRYKPLSPSELKAAAVRWGSYREVAKRLGVPESSVRRVANSDLLGTGDKRANFSERNERKAAKAFSEKISTHEQREIRKIEKVFNQAWRDKRETAIPQIEAVMRQKPQQRRESIKQLQGLKTKRARGGRWMLVSGEIPGRSSPKRRGKK